MPNKEQDKKPVADKPEPNIAYVGKPEEEGREHDAPQTKIKQFRQTITLPSAEEQQKPFYHKDAGTIISLFPHLYKRVEPKA